MTNKMNEGRYNLLTPLAISGFTHLIIFIDKN